MLSVILNQNIAIYLKKKYKLLMITVAILVVLVHVKVDSGDDKLDHLIGIVYFPSINTQTICNNNMKFMSRKNNIDKYI